MTRAYNNALVIVRSVGVLFITMSFMGLAYITYSVGFFAAGGEGWRWLVDPALYYSARVLRKPDLPTYRGHTPVEVQAHREIYRKAL